MSPSCGIEPCTGLYMCTAMDACMMSMQSWACGAAWKWHQQCICTACTGRCQLCTEHSLVAAAGASSIRARSLLQSRLRLTGALVEEAGALRKLGDIGGAAGGHITTGQGAQRHSAAVAVSV